MRQLSADEVHAAKVAELGLGPGVPSLATVEAMAAALRRAARFLCPCTSATLVRTVVPPLRGLVADLEEAQRLARDTLEGMAAHGDFLECRNIESDVGAVLLYSGPGGFVARESGTVILLGESSDPLPDDLSARIEHTGHLRKLSPAPGEDLPRVLVELGLIKTSYEHWLKAPPPESPDQHVARLNQLLDRAGPSRDVPGLSLLDSTRPVTFYRGRWVEPRNQSGRFVARRSQAYGADLWCYVEMNDGNPERLVDFPVPGSRWRGCDEAWHLQMAIDAGRGERQRFRIRPGSMDTWVMCFFTPVPMWARRRWDAVGEPVSASGSLFAYGIAGSELEEEIRFADKMLWLCEMSRETRRQRG